MEERQKLLATLEEVVKKKDKELFNSWRARLVDERSLLVDRISHEVLHPFISSIILDRIREIDRVINSPFTLFAYELFKIIQRAKARRGDNTMIILTDNLEEWSKGRLWDREKTNLLEGRYMYWPFYNCK